MIDINLLPVNYPGPRVRNFTVCLSPLHSNYSDAWQLLETIELNRIFGAEHFFIYNVSMSQNVDRVLRSYQDVDSFVTIVQWPIEGIKTWYFGQVTAISDCIYRNRNISRFVIVTDADEVIVPAMHNNWWDMLHDVASNVSLRDTDFENKDKFSNILKTRYMDSARRDYENRQNDVINNYNANIRSNNKNEDNDSNSNNKEHFEIDNSIDDKTYSDNNANKNKGSNEKHENDKDRSDREQRETPGNKHVLEFKSNSRPRRENALNRNMTQLDDFSTENDSVIPNDRKREDSFRKANLIVHSKIQDRVSSSSTQYSNNYHDEDIEQIDSFSFRCAFYRESKLSLMDLNDILSTSDAQDSTFTQDQLSLMGKMPSVAFKSLFRSDKPFIHGRRSKYIVRPELINLIGIHILKRHYDTLKTVFVKMQVGLLHHYRVYHPRYCKTLDTSVLKFKDKFFDSMQKAVQPFDFLYDIDKGTDD